MFAQVIRRKSVARRPLCRVIDCLDLTVDSPSIILNTKLIILNTKFITLNAKFNLIVDPLNFGQHFLRRLHLPLAGVY